MNGIELRQAMAALPYITGGPAHSWPKHRLSIRNHAANDDPAQFLRWSTIRATMFVGTGAAFVEPEYNALKDRYRAIIKEPGFGSPETFDVDGITTSGNLIHQAYHLQQLEQASGVNVEHIRWIVEFGGGYGAMALLCRRLGFVGEYAIIDLPEMSLLQEYYLSNTAGLDNIDFISDFPKSGWNIFTDLFIANYSLSEIPADCRNELLTHIHSHHYFVAYQEQFTMPDGERVDNIAYFNGANRRWRNWQNEAMPGHYYAIG